MSQPEFMSMEPTPAQSPDRASALFSRLALMAATIGVAGSLYLSIGLDLRACPLCFYQRTFVMSAFAVLFVGPLALPGRQGLFALLASPMVFGGLAVAVWHESLVLREVLECPVGMTKKFTAPAEALTMFAILGFFTLAAAVAGRGSYRLNFAVAVPLTIILGIGLAYGCILSSPPPPEPKPHPPGGLKTCQPVWRGEKNP